MWLESVPLPMSCASLQSKYKRTGKDLRTMPRFPHKLVGLPEDFEVCRGQAESIERRGLAASQQLCG